MNKYLISLVVVVIVLVGAYYLLFTNPESQPAQQTATSTVETVKIGVILPLSGDYTTVGEAALAGAQTAAKEINGSGGVNGRNIEIVTENDGCSKEGGVSAVTRLAVSHQVTAVIGSLCSVATAVATPVAQAAGIPMVIPGASAAGLAAAGDFIFRIHADDAAEGTAAANYLVTTLKKKKVAIIYIKSEWGQNVNDSFKERFKELGGTVVVGASIDEEGTEAAAITLKLKAAKPEVVYLPTSAVVGLTFLKKIAEAKIKTVVVGGSQWDGTDLITSKEASGAFYFVPKITDFEKLKNSVKEATGKEANIFTPFVYDAVKLLTEIIKQTGTDKKSIRNALVTVYYDKGVSSPVIEFNDGRELKEPLFDVMEINDGAVKVIGTMEEAAPTSTTTSVSTSTASSTAQ